jgi:hypothetical protein
MLIDNVREGISAELKACSEYEEFVVRRVEDEGAIHKVFLSLEEGDGRLDESLEGSSAWWPGPPKGAADVLSVIPEEEQINLRFATTAPPGQGQRIRVYPPMYLAKLLELWERPGYGELCLAWWSGHHAANGQDQQLKVSPQPFPWLRSAQRNALDLVTWKSSYLWGPPGTGKTTTLGAMLAALMVQCSGKRVLLLSTTNTAVDQALIAVDEKLAELTKGQPQPAPIRKKCMRIGNHFQATRYQGREHLIPVKDQNLILQLAQLEVKIPDKSDVGAYQKWKSQVESVRMKIRGQALDALRNARVAAMTTTRAVFTYDEIASTGAFDLIVFDEASQVGLAHALALVPLGRRVLFAGDPQQLAPIVKSSDADAKDWLGRSAFFKMEKKAPYTCLLDEQSRMAEQICKVVSNAFYDGLLKVAGTCKSDSKWKNERRAFSVLQLGSKNAYLVPTTFESKYSPKYGGHIRFETAELILKLVDDLLNAVDQSDILILTPYRAQRTLLRTFMKNAGYKRVLVSTVHRAQGSERNTVIFDPVLASSSFLNNHDLGPRLMNVAISRAQARLILIASPENLLNPVLEQIANILAADVSIGGAQSLHDLALTPNFPTCALKKTVYIKRQNGTITKGTVDDVQNGDLLLIDHATGKKVKFKVDVLRQAALAKLAGI